MRLIKGIIKNVIVEYIEYEENTYHNRTQTIIKKKTSFSVNNEIFYTFENINIEEGKKEIFYVNNENKVTFFGKSQVNDSFEERSRKKIADNKRETKACGFLNFILAPLCGMLLLLLLHDIKNIQDIPIIVQILVTIGVIGPFLFFAGNFLHFRNLRKDMKNLKEKIKTEKESIDDFERSSSDVKNYEEIKNEIVVS